MRTFYLVTTIMFGLFFFTTNLTAQTQTDEEKLEVCIKISQLARVIMSNRQQNVPMSVMMESITDKPTAEQAKASELSKLLTLAAYKQPRFSTPTYIQNAITDFENKVLMDCINGSK